ncbi:SDR family NAD(P)-dependent oxidoreductase [Litorimonas sp.]|uniref:SDR family NAD(P)-dependent oxidoreductase n=1 Tax=Litorimonas sp. TaxID=1892381 RepID=UPI003A844FDF
MILPSMGENLRVVVIGASGGIGGAFLDALNEADQVSKIYALSRQGKSHPSEKIDNLTFDLTSEKSLKAAAESLRETDPFDLIIIATGLLQGDGISPEKSIRDLSYKGLEKSFLVNTIGPAMTARYFLPLLREDRKSVFTALSARVGSISDNRIGGWYGYRASKAALNMILKTLSIEHGRRHKQAVILGLHPGTVDTDLSKPFQGNVPEDKLFSPEYSIEKLLSVIDQVSAEDSGKLFDWAGKEVAF